MAQSLQQMRELRQAMLSAAPQTLPPRRAEDVLAEIEPHLISYGITRVGELTALDVVGIPVFTACRPNSRSLSVCMGKSLHADRARLGAIMECLEQAVAERHEELVVARAKQSEMERRGLHCIDPAAIFRTTTGKDPNREQSWVPGLSARWGTEIFVPYELVGLDLREDGGWDRSTYRMSSIGLGAGSSLVEATLHALLEVVEYDATAPIQIFGLGSAFARPLTHQRGHHNELDEALSRVETAGLRCLFADISGSIPLPVIAAFIKPGDVVPGHADERLFAGFACRASAQEAALAALLEAVQSRLTQISGARDDLSPRDYIPQPAKLKQAPENASPLHVIDGFVASDRAAQPVEQLHRAIRTLIEAGAEDVFLIPLGGIAGSVSVVRVLAPGLQAATDDGAVRLGMHSLTTLLQAARATH